MFGAMKRLRLWQTERGTHAPVYACRMTSARNAVIGLVLALPLTPRASALCIYHGKMNAKTTIRQEFADSRWVVQAKVTAADYHWADEGESWTIYHLQVLIRFKGDPPVNIELFTYRDSGGFYLDKGVDPDLGGEYLLFLDPISPALHAPAAAHGATEVNYNCGQSKEWSQVTAADRSELARLSAGDHAVERPRKSN